MTDMTVANTILQQLGGKKFLMMVGAKQATGTENSLGVKFTAKAKNKANFLRVRLNAMDTYDVEFLSLRGLNSSIKGYIEGVYADQLQAVFTKETGLYTSLGTMGREVKA